MDILSLYIMEKATYVSAQQTTRLTMGAECGVMVEGVVKEHCLGSLRFEFQFYSWTKRIIHWPCDFLVIITSFLTQADYLPH